MQDFSKFNGRIVPFGGMDDNILFLNAAAYEKSLPKKYNFIEANHDAQGKCFNLNTAKYDAARETIDNNYFRAGAIVIPFICIFIRCLIDNSQSV